MPPSVVLPVEGPGHADGAGRLHRVGEILVIYKKIRITSLIFITVTVYYYDIFLYLLSVLIGFSAKDVDFFVVPREGHGAKVTQRYFMIRETSFPCCKVKLYSLSVNNHYESEATVPV